ncbi:MAG: 30S ribosome-binding factor RbfA [Verrucomicrobiales bacterium]|jgi:ribosome-binding factor A|nr:30S ribosome-binding factor RbfA [Verrucomicrobiales bacterium]MBT5845287.1 30S ribosome-binding factor RbfA [Verrucomicrobiales bacterium]MDE2713864.1 30S ribosome-binding factor RbfA [Verrucomicrobiota bacterium]|tara:strand:- start:296 stop:670 length:375 start_codon:yes stop_codon:yes gene_type:complete
MPSLRQQRVRELLKRTVGEILRRELDSESCGIITVNDVGMASDLHSAMVFVSVLGSDEQKRTAAKRLKSERSRIQYMLGREVVLKYTPRIKFELDDAIEAGNRVMSILEEMEQANPTKPLEEDD